MTAATSVRITGNHPYADEFPMASEDELAELTDSISMVGLIHPIVITPDGQVLDGRNRREACSRADFDPEIVIREGTDDEYKEFVIGVNTTGRRESMTVQIAAASTALILGEDKRINGQWRRGSVRKEFSPNENGAWRFAIKCSGLVLDILGRDALRKVRDGEATLNAAYEYALQQRDEEKRQLADAERADQEEDEAREYLVANAPELLGEVGGKYETAREARAVWLERNRKEKSRIERERRDHDESIQRDARRLSAFLSGYDQAYSMREHQFRDEVLAALSKSDRTRFTRIEEETAWPSTRI